MSPTVRRATADSSDDVAQIATIIDEVLTEGVPVIFEGPMAPAEVRAWIERMGDGGAMFVVEDGGRVLAFAAIDPSEDDPSECSLGSWVRLDERRKGYATLLAEAALAFARERGYKGIRGRLPEGNQAALSYLSAIGAMVPLTNPGAHFELPLEQE
ncbi:MAG: GNAT family N-acetyltransferase [Chloroflexi bacterium]|nr:GNAT family N-acetyltransferase [Chloroflexota bacterium]